MAKESDDAYRISGNQLVESRSKRNVIPCCLSADIGLGGGIQQGCTVVIGGRPGLGKTTAALQYGANAQNKFGSKIFFYPVEGRLTQQVLQQIQGIKLESDYFEVIMPPIIQNKKGEIIGHKKWDAQRWWSVIGDTISENPNSVHIVDSIANLTTDAELAEGMGHQSRGGLQKSEAQFCRIYGNLIIASGVTLFLLTQVQANTSGYGANLQIKVGNAIKHQADVILFGKSVEKWPEEDGRVRGHDMVYTVEKSGMGQSNLDIKIPLRYGVGIDTIRDLMNHAITWDIIRKKGSWFQIPFVENDNKIDFIEGFAQEEVKYILLQGEHKLWTWLNNHPGPSNIISESVIKKVML